MTKEIAELTAKTILVGTEEVAIQETSAGTTLKATISNILLIKGKAYELGSDAVAQAHVGIVTGYIIKTNYRTSARILESGSEVAFTGTTTVARNSGLIANWPFTDGFFYDTDGKQFENISAFPNVRQWGAVGDGSTDDTVAVQSAIEAAGATGNNSAVTLYVGAGEFLIDSDSLTVTTLAKAAIIFQGLSKYRSVFKAGSNLSAASKPSMTGGTYALVLSEVPIMAWNDTTGCQIHDIGFDGDDKEVYGLYINESFFSNFTRVRIIGCNQRPFTAVRHQAATYTDFSCFQNGQGGAGFDGSMLFYDTTGLSFSALNVERNGTDRYALEIFQPNNKGGWFFSNPWFEVEATGNLPALGFMSVGGRNVSVISPYMTYGATATGELAYDLKATSDTLVTDGITMTTITAVNCELQSNDVSSPTLGIEVASTCAGNRIHGFFDAAKVVNNAAATLGNSFEVNQFADSTGYPSVSGGFRISDSAGAGGQPISATDYIALFTDGLVNFFNNANNKLLLNSGILELHSNLSLRLNATTGTVTLQSGGADAVRGDNTTTAGQTRLLVYDVDNATVERVTVGVADSGGANFKLLRIPN